jgi:hypothetical protein
MFLFYSYAFIGYDNERQALKTIKHADRYKIRGQALVISSYRPKTSICTTTR